MVTYSPREAARGGRANEISACVKYFLFRVSNHFVIVNCKLSQGRKTVSVERYDTRTEHYVKIAETILIVTINIRYRALATSLPFAFSTLWIEKNRKIYRLPGTSQALCSFKVTM